MNSLPYHSVQKSYFPFNIDFFSLVIIFVLAVQKISIFSWSDHHISLQRVCRDILWVFLASERQAKDAFTELDDFIEENSEFDLHQPRKGKVFYLDVKEYQRLRHSEFADEMQDDEPHDFENVATELLGIIDDDFSPKPWKTDFVSFKWRFFCRVPRWGKEGMGTRRDPDQKGMVGTLYPSTLHTPKGLGLGPLMAEI